MWQEVWEGDGGGVKLVILNLNFLIFHCNIFRNDVLCKFLHFISYESFIGEHS